MVEIFSDEQSRGLRYGEAANSGGYQPTAAQVTEWVLRPSRRPAQRGRLIEPATPPTFPAAIGSHLADMVTGLGQPKWMDNLALTELVAPARGLGERILANTGGAVSFSERFLGTPARYGPGKPAKTYIEHMVRMSWIDADDTGGLRLTPLGRALVRHDAFSRQAEDEPSVIVLEADSPLSYVTARRPHRRVWCGFRDRPLRPRGVSLAADPGHDDGAGAHRAAAVQERPGPHRTPPDPGIGPIGRSRFGEPPTVFCTTVSSSGIRV